MPARRNPGLSIVLSATSSAAPSAFLSPRTPRLSSQRYLLGRTPPASPGLPPVSARQAKRTKSWTTSRIAPRAMLALCGVTILFYLLVRRHYTHQFIPNFRAPEETGYEIVGGNSLPQEPSVVIVTNKKGKAKWTVSIPGAHEFPLRPAQYRDLCAQSMEVSHQLMEMSKGVSKRHRGYYQVDPFFLDVKDAEEQRLLLPSPSSGAVEAGMANESGGDAPGVCEKTLTYVMETADAGFGTTLMGLWMSYGLAQKEGRAFFVDDTRWPYGRYASYFLAPPKPSCLPPPKNQIIPCPHSARHLLVSAATTSLTFGHEFEEEFEDPKKMEVQRQHRIFALLRTGYEALFKLRDDDAGYILERVSQLRNATEAKDGFNVGLHVRRGDRHPYEFQYSDDYIPLERFVSTAEDVIAETLEYLPFSSSASGKRKSRKPSISAKSKGDDPLAALSSHLILASDDPRIYTAPELTSAIRAQERIVLGTKEALEAMSTSPKNPFIDEISGWDGGFYHDVFWSLGRSAHDAKETESLKAGVADDVHAPFSSAPASASPSLAPGTPPKDAAAEVPESAMRLREFVGRGYLLDLAVLGQMDAVVCTVSSVGCRLLAVMLGWEQSINEGRWQNVDGKFGWRGIVW